MNTYVFIYMCSRFNLDYNCACSKWETSYIQHVFFLRQFVLLGIFVAATTSYGSAVPSIVLIQTSHLFSSNDHSSDKDSLSLHTFQSSIEQSLEYLHSGNLDSFYLLLGRSRQLTVEDSLITQLSAHYYQAAIILYQRSDYTEVLSLLDTIQSYDVLSSLPDYYKFINLEAGIYIVTGQVDRAIPIYRNGLSHENKPAWVDKSFRQNLMVAYESSFELDSLYRLRYDQLISARQEQDSIQLSHAYLGFSRLAQYIGAQDAQLTFVDSSLRYLGPHHKDQYYRVLFARYEYSMDATNSTQYVQELYQLGSIPFTESAVIRRNIDYLMIKAQLINGQLSEAINRLEELEQQILSDNHKYEIASFYSLYIEALLHEEYPQCEQINTIIDFIYSQRPYYGITDKVNDILADIELYQHCIDKDELVTLVSDREVILSKIFSSKSMSTNLFAIDDATSPADSITYRSTTIILILVALLSLLFLGIIWWFKLRSKQYKQEVRRPFELFEHNTKYLINDLKLNLEKAGDSVNYELNQSFNITIFELEESIHKYKLLHTFDKRSMTFESVDPFVLIQDLVSDLDYAEYITVSKSSFAEIRVDRFFFKHVILNIISNAYKFKKLNESLAIKISFYKDHDNCCISIQDKGIGLAMETGHDVFSEGQTFHNREMGSNSGLGLYFSKRIINLFNGEISLISSVNQWTEVLVKLPLITNP